MELDKTKFSFIAIKLEKSSRDLLRRTASEICYRYNMQYDGMKEFCDHITLAYGSEITDCHLNFIGEYYKDIGIEKIVFNDKCMSALLSKRDINRLQRELSCMREFPHVTLRTNFETYPFYSNKLLEVYENGICEKFENMKENLISSIDIIGMKLKGKVIGVLTDNKKEIESL